MTRRLTGLMASLLIVGIIIGLPVVLLAVAGNPLPHPVARPGRGHRLAHQTRRRDAGTRRTRLGWLAGVAVPERHPAPRSRRRHPRHQGPQAAGGPPTPDRRPASRRRRSTALHVLPHPGTGSRRLRRPTRTWTRGQPASHPSRQQPGSNNPVPRQVVGRISSRSKLGMVGSARPRCTSRGRFQAIASWGRVSL